MLIRIVALAWMMVAFGTISVRGGPLESAESLMSSEFVDYKYGSSGPKRIDCVQFVVRVVEEELSRSLSPDERKLILISDLPSNAVAQAVQDNDPRIRGLLRALVDRMHVAVAISPADAKKGDFIQYWMKQSDGTWFGHAAIISREIPGAPGEKRVAIFGAHATPGPSGFLGEKDFGYGLNLAGSDRKVFVARMNN